MQYLSRIIKCTHEQSLHGETFWRHRQKQYHIFWFHTGKSLNNVRNQWVLNSRLSLKLLAHVHVLIQREGSRYANTKQKSTVSYIQLFSEFHDYVSEGLGAFSTNVLFHNVVSFRSISNAHVTHISVKPELWSKWFINTTSNFFKTFQVFCSRLNLLLLLLFLRFLQLNQYWEGIVRVYFDR